MEQIDLIMRMFPTNAIPLAMFSGREKRLSKLIADLSGAQTYLCRNVNYRIGRHSTIIFLVAAAAISTGNVCLFSGSVFVHCDTGLNEKKCNVKFRVESKWLAVP